MVQGLPIKTLERSLQVGFHNGSVLNWCQAIILANDDPVLWCNMPHQAPMNCELKIVGDLGPRICIFFIENYHILLKFVPKGSIHNKSALVQVMAWWRIGNKLLPETMLTKTYDAIWHHTASLGLKQLFMHQERKYIHDIINDDLQRIFCTEVDTLIKETSKFTDTKSCMSVWLDFPYNYKSWSGLQTWFCLLRILCAYWYDTGTPFIIIYRWCAWIKIEKINKLGGPYKMAAIV